MVVSIAGTNELFTFLLIDSFPDGLLSTTFGASNTDVGEQPISGDGEQPISGVGEQPISGVGEQPISGVGEQPISGVREEAISGVGEQPISGVGVVVCPTSKMSAMIRASLNHRQHRLVNPKSC